MPFSELVTMGSDWLAWSHVTVSEPITVGSDWPAWSHVTVSEPITMGSDWPALGVLLIPIQKVDSLSELQGLRVVSPPERDSATRGGKGAEPQMSRASITMPSMLLFWERAGVPGNPLGTTWAWENNPHSKCSDGV